MKMYNVNGISVLVFPDKAGAVEFATREIVGQLAKKPASVIGFCTGGTAEPVYARLAELYRSGEVSFRDATSFNLDEYYPIDRDHDQSYSRFMRANLFDQVDIDSARVFIPDGGAADPESEAKRYEGLLAAQGPIDLLFAGIGLNTHIGFNEPPTAGDSRTRMVTLSEETRRVNSRYFSSVEDVPRHSITMGLGNIREARRIVLCAFGAAKADAVRRTLTSQPSPETPGAFIQGHADCTFVMDGEAAADFLCARQGEEEAGIVRD